MNYARLLLAINVANLERRGIATTAHDLTDAEREAGHAALDDAENALFNGEPPFDDPAELTESLREYRAEEGERLREALEITRHNEGDE